MDLLGIDSDQLWPAKADNSALFVAPEFLLLSGENDYRIDHNFEIVDWDRLTDSLNS